MALKDKIDQDIMRTFMRLDHFADYHYWNGFQIICVPDEEEALKRPNNNVNDISWDSNTRQLLIHTPLAGFPGGKEPEPNTQVMFDNRSMKVVYVHHNMGVLEICLGVPDPREF